MYKKYSALLYTACVILLLGVFLYVMPVQGECGIYGGVLRLHIPAASDSERDQSVKLKVRDAVLEVCGEITRDAIDIEQARELISGRLGCIEAAANAVLADEGAGYTATVTLGREVYPTRSYEGYTLPCGEYMSLRVALGGGDGANWWCILFPQICVSAAVGGTDEAEAVMASLTPEQYKTITGADGRYVIKFKLLELFSALFVK